MSLPDRAGGTRQPSLLDLLSLRDAKRFVPETLVILLLVVAARSLWDANGPGTGGLHGAFWIPVLLMAVQYGIMGGLFAALSSSLLLVATELPAPSAAQDFYGYAAAAAAQPCAWFAASLVLGGLRTLHMHNEARTAARLAEATASAELFADQLVDMGSELARLEERIATDTACASVLLDALARIDLSSAPALLASLADVVRHGAGAESFTVFLRQGDVLVPCLGVAGGVPVPGGALASLRLPAPDQAGQEAQGSRGAGVAIPLQVPILPIGGGAPIGFLVCSGIAPGYSTAITARRLKDVCRVLAKLLPLLRDQAGPGAPAGLPASERA